MRYVLRVLALPFFIGLMVISSVFALFIKSFYWVKYGGEAVNYSDKMNRKTISDVFYKLNELS